MRTMQTLVIGLAFGLTGCGGEHGSVATAQRRGGDGLRTLAYWNQANAHLKDFREKHALFTVSAALVKESDEQLREKLALLMRVFSAQMEGLKAEGVDAEALDLNQRLVGVLQANPEWKGAE